MKITSITVIEQKSGPDVLVFDTDLPPATHPFDSSPYIKMNVASLTGKRYVAENFPEVTDVRVVPAG